MSHTSKGSTISRLQARKAVRSVKVTNAVGARKTSASKLSRTVAPAILERYLGHFGVGTGGAAKKSAAVKTLVKPSARKSTRKAS